ncbi:hypothetical protein SERLADRAFT_375890 [Serpula lacrymans var. lacrymans S7.9]|uniref:Uncharacterized protein n=1 Tax=Serpula lacrymans var. lacrymans (strain S7.9) TaxID=578457 RepID=F8NEP4_SERL9|nr:uncharacterized protein SERLADRAFT_375890 [Serpula lacrymans var. lacrymans S7.9]EGO30678.1 hypothetical protein SERLADRAFT_375890 [Serpula lacrymans var. lacrymans S7.9]
MIKLRAELAGIGASVDNWDFSAMILSSLLESYCPILTSMITAARISWNTLSPKDIIGHLIDEADH